MTVQHWNTVPCLHESVLWRYMSVMESQITSHTTVLSTADANIKENITAPHYCPFVRGNHRWIPITRSQ